MTHLVTFSAVTWNFPLIGRSRMLSEAWLRLGVPTMFVQVPFLRTALERLWPLRRPEPVRVIRPWPAYPRRLWPVLSESRLRAGIRRAAGMLRRQLDPDFDWTQAAAIVVSPIWAPWLDGLPFRRVVYDCIDDCAVHVPHAALAPLYQRWEAELINRANAAVATAECLAAGLRERRPGLPTAIIRNGVDAERFAALAARAGRPTDLPSGRRPIVGFVGAMYNWLDWDLMGRVARAMPDVDFVFIGPHNGRGQVETLADIPGVHLLGHRPYGQIPAYVQAFDVCWVPFARGQVAAAANPVKIYEYLALGKPVVSTPVADIEAFGGHVTVAHDAEAMIAALRAALRDDSSTAAAARSALARENSWEARARALVDFVDLLGD
jgi:glycosyltransferase involved in cell wall biosynthesis